MELASSMFKELLNVWKAMFEVLAEIVPKAFKFLIWVLLGIIILPCVYIAGNWFPKWTDWGEDSF
jgi:hypothetical protein